MEAVLGVGVDDDAAGTDFADWVTPHLSAMAALAARLAPQRDRDDIVQDALLRAWRKRSSYDGERGSARVWLLAIVADRARRARTRGPRAVLIDRSEPAVDPDRDLDLELALRQLSSRQQLAVALHYFLGLSVAEAAVVMGCAEGTVKSTLYDARSRLGVLLEVADEG